MMLGWLLVTVTVRAEALGAARRTMLKTFWPAKAFIGKTWHPIRFTGATSKLATSLSPFKEAVMEPANPAGMTLDRKVKFAVLCPARTVTVAGATAKFPAGA